MKTLLLVTALLLIYSCEAQPNRPLTALDKIDRLNIPKKLVNKDPISNAQSPLPIPNENSKTDNTNSLNTNKSKIIFKGYIFDIQTKNPLNKVKININNVSVETDINGNFSIPDINIGIYDFIASKEGYIDYLSNMDIKTNFGGVYIYMRKKA